MTGYFKIRNGNRLVKAPNSIASKQELCKRLHYLPLEDVPPECPKGSRLERRYELRSEDGRKTFNPLRAEKIVAVYDVLPAYTADDYDRAMEDYLTSVRTERGYTTREPSDYLNSSVPRWAQDAADWIAFRDAVMGYALTVINEYQASGNAPSLAEFKAGFPTITWSYKEGEAQ